MDWLSLANLALALISLGIGLWVFNRFSGRLKIALTCILLALVLVVVREVLILLDIIQSALSLGLMRTGIVILLLIALLNIKKIVDFVNGKYK